MSTNPALPHVAVIRARFEASVKRSKAAATTPLGTVTINGAFHHYADADTDTLWIGYLAGFRAGWRSHPNQAAEAQPTKGELTREEEALARNIPTSKAS